MTIILFFVVLLAGCQKDVVVDAVETMTYTVVPEVWFEVKSSQESQVQQPGTASLINVVWYGVYHKKANGDYVYMNDMSAFVEVQNPADIKVPITLIQDQEYRIVFVAQHRMAPQDADHIYMYNVDEQTGVMTRNTAAAITSGEQLDAFVYVDTVGPVNGSHSKSITLHRPVAQINIATSQTPLPTDIDITLSNVSASYNIFERTFSDQTTLTFENLTPTDASVSVNSVNYHGLTTLYVLGGNNVDMQISCDGNIKTISNIAIAENYKTNIVGNI